MFSHTIKIQSTEGYPEGERYHLAQGNAWPHQQCVPSFPQQKKYKAKKVAFENTDIVVASDQIDTYLCVQVSKTILYFWLFNVVS